MARRMEGRFLLRSQAESMTSASDPQSRHVVAFSALRALRPHQWSKNLLIFVPLFVGHGYGEPSRIISALLGFVCLCGLASATYMANDIADIVLSHHESPDGTGYPRGLSAEHISMEAAILRVADVFSTTGKRPARRG